MECLAFALSHCWSDYQHFCTKKKQKQSWMLENSSTYAFVGILRGCVRLAFLINALKEKSLSSYYGIQWMQKCSLLSLLPLFFLSTAASTSACVCTPSPEALLDFSLTSCSLNECFDALHNTSFHLENIFQMFGLEHWELDDKHLIVGNQNFSSVVLGLTPITLAPPQYVIDTPLRDGVPPL